MIRTASDQTGELQQAARAEASAQAMDRDTVIAQIEFRAYWRVNMNFISGCRESTSDDA